MTIILELLLINWWLSRWRMNLSPMASDGKSIQAEAGFRETDELCNLLEKTNF
jgi:hypothetical protein